MKCGRRRCAVMLPALLLMACVVLGACTPKPPKQLSNICAIVDDHSRWYKYARRAEKKWGVPPSLIFAIIRQESAFKANAKPKRKRFLGIPLWRPSSASGYAQALDPTWDHYKRSAGKRFVERDNLKDAADFVGWYVHQSHRQLNIPMTDGYRHYLAYHDGWGGYKRGTWKSKEWLQEVAQRVATVELSYRKQLAKCR